MESMLSSPSGAPLAGAATASGKRAVGEAIWSAIERLGARQAGCVLLFSGASLDAEAAAKAAKLAARGVPVAGVTTSGELSAAGPTEGGCVAVALDSSIRVGIGVAENASRGPRAAGRSAAGAALQQLGVQEGNRVLLLLLDTRSGDQAESVSGAYEAAGPSVPLAGGAAGGREPAQFAAETAYADSVVAVALESRRPIGVGMSHGSTPHSVPSIVTRSEGRKLLQLDGRPAEQVYLEKLGCAGAELTDVEFEALAVVHPLALPGLSGDVWLRHVLGRAPGGGLNISTRIPPNAAVGFTYQSSEAIASSAFDAVGRALDPLGGEPARAALVFDCAGRKRAAGGGLKEEVAAIASSFGDAPPPFAGAYVHGEIGRVRGPKGDRNHAIVVVAFG